MDFACDMMPPLISLEALCVILDANRPVPASSQFPNSHSNNNVNDKTFLVMIFQPGMCFVSIQIASRFPRQFFCLSVCPHLSHAQ